MPTDLLPLPTPQAAAGDPLTTRNHLPDPKEPETRGVNIRGVPKAVWQRARQNALLSGLPCRTYVIRLLAECQPFPPASTTMQGRE